MTPPYPTLVFDPDSHLSLQPYPQLLDYGMVLDYLKLPPIHLLLESSFLVFGDVIYFSLNYVKLDTLYLKSESIRKNVPLFLYYWCVLGEGAWG